MEENSKIINLKQSLSAVAFIIILVIVLISFFSFLNSRRQAGVHRQYETETNAYIAKNFQGLNKLFTQVFPDEVDSCFVESPQFNSCSASVNQRRDQIAHLLSSDLKDFSSTMFVKENNRREILVMRLSGDARPLIVYPPGKETLVRGLLEGKVDNIPWDHYSTELFTKEIYLPVKDEDGKIIGAIVRGVIE